MRRTSLGLLLLAGCAKADGHAAADPGPVAAVGIRVASVEANQGVAVPIGRAGAGIDGSARTAALIHGRRTLVRAYWEVDEGWHPRTIDAVLRLRTHAGEERSLTSRRLVAAPSAPEDLRRAFTWMLDADEASPGLQYRVELYEGSGDEPLELDSEQVDPDTAPPALPELGFFQVGLEPSLQELEVVVVPIERDDDDCVAVPDTSNERIALFHDRLHMMLPVQQVHVSVREPVVWPEPLSELDPVIDMLGELKQSDGVASQVYYYGLLGSCGSIGGYSGQAHSIPVVPVQTQPWVRVAVGLSKPDAQATAHIVAHELGHGLGRRHIACSGDENKPDESYPYRDGSIGNWGFGVLDDQLRSPAAAADYMGYCDEDWVSDFGWNITFFFIRRLGLFPPQGHPAGGRVLVGAIDPDGEQRWFAAEGTVAPEGHDRSARVIWQSAEGSSITAPASLSRRPHGETVNLVVAAPDPGLEITGAVYELPGGRRAPIDADALLRNGVRSR